MNLGYGTNKSTGIVLELITFVPQNILRLVPQIITLTTLCPLASPSLHAIYIDSLSFICLYQDCTRCTSFSLFQVHHSNHRFQLVELKCAQTCMLNQKLLLCANEPSLGFEGLTASLTITMCRLINKRVSR